MALGLYWFLNQETPKHSQGRGLTTSAHGDITKITILRDGLDTISIQRSTSNWQLVQPINAPANNTRIKLLLSILNASSHAQLSHIDDATLTQLGFNNANTILKLDDASFQFGNIEPISKRRYVLHNDVIHLIDDNVAPLLNANAASFIDNKLILLNNQISKLVLPTLNTDQTISTDNITIEQKEGHWTSDDSKFSSDELTTLIDSWQYTYALQVLPLSTAKLPLSEPHKIVVSFHNQTEPVELQLQKDNRTLYLNSPSQQLSYQFPVTLIQQLLPANL